MGASYIGYSLVMPTDEKLYRPALDEQIKKVEALFKPIGGVDGIDKASPKKCAAVRDAMAEAKMLDDNLGDMDDPAETLRIVAESLDIARKFSFDEYGDLRDGAYTLHTINGVEVAFLNAGDSTWGDDPADLGNEAAKQIRAIGYIGGYEALYKTVPWTGPRKVGRPLVAKAKRGASVVQSLLDAKSSDEAHDLIVNNTDELEALVAVVGGA